MRALRGRPSKCRASPASTLTKVRPPSRRDSSATSAKRGSSRASQDRPHAKCASWAATAPMPPPPSRRARAAPTATRWETNSEQTARPPSRATTRSPAAKYRRRAKRGRALQRLGWPSVTCVRRERTRTTRASRCARHASPATSASRVHRCLPHARPARIPAARIWAARRTAWSPPRETTRPKAASSRPNVAPAPPLPMRAWACAQSAKGASTNRARVR